MKHLILAAAAALTLTTANAQDCKGIGDIAEKLMELRQAGGALSDIMSNPDPRDPDHPGIFGEDE